MASEVLNSVAVDIGMINEKIKDAKELISAMRDAGEDVSKLTSDMNILEIRKTKWERMLDSRGIPIPK